MSDVDLELLRRELERDGIGELLLRELWDTVRANAPLRPPRVYAGESSWTPEALADVLQGWIEKRLVGRKDLAGMLRKSRTLVGFRRALATSLGQHMTNEAAGGSAWQLFDRLRKLLAESTDFVNTEGPPRKGHGRWALADGPTDPSALRLTELVRVAHELSDAELPVTRYGRFSKYADPILRKPALRKFLVHLLRAAAGSLALRQIHDVMRQRFNLGLREAPEGLLDVAELADTLPTDEPAPLEVAERRALAKSVLARATPDQVDAARAIHRADGNLADAARAVGRPPDDVRAAFEQVIGMIAEITADDETVEDVYDAVLEMLFPDLVEPPGDDR